MVYLDVTHLCSFTFPCSNKYTFFFHFEDSWETSPGDLTLGQVQSEAQGPVNGTQRPPPQAGRGWIASLGWGHPL
jgi:hypothetical protein